MGQYYMVYAKNDDGVKVYDRSVNGEYMMAKLMEHSWWYNSFVGTFCRMIYKNPTQVAWVGNYSYEVDCEIFEDIWGADVKTIGVDENVLLLDGKYLLNHTKKEFLKCDEYRKECEVKKWCIHPLPLLTCIGNGLGCGDYKSKDENKFVGYWYLDEISVEDEIPVDYKEISPRFIE